MADAVASVSKQLEDLSESLAVNFVFCFETILAYYIFYFFVDCDLLYLLTQSTKKHLSKKLATLDWKVEEQTETSKMILSDVKNPSYFLLFRIDVLVFPRLRIRIRIHLSHGYLLQCRLPR